jgi:hypothetical protein
MLIRTCGKNIDIKDLNVLDLPTFLPEYESFGGGKMKSTLNKIPELEELFK